MFSNRIEVEHTLKLVKFRHKSYPNFIHKFQLKQVSTETTVINKNYLWSEFSQLPIDVI